MFNGTEFSHNDKKFKVMEHKRISSPVAHVFAHLFSQELADATQVEGLGDHDTSILLVKETENLIILIAEDYRPMGDTFLLIGVSEDKYKTLAPDTK